MLEPIVKWFEMVSEISKILPGTPMVSKYAGVFGSPLYSGDLDNGLVWYGPLTKWHLNIGQKDVAGYLNDIEQLVCYSNVDLNTGPICLLLL